MTALVPLPPSRPRVATGRIPNSPAAVPLPRSLLLPRRCQRARPGEARSAQAAARSSRPLARWRLARVSSTGPEPGSSAGKQGGRRSSGRRRDGRRTAAGSRAAAVTPAGAPLPCGGGGVPPRGSAAAWCRGLCGWFGAATGGGGFPAGGDAPGGGGSDLGPA
jgi:hypothetical protein